jgi:hypothetical protein
VRYTLGTVTPYAETGLFTAAGHIRRVFRLSAVCPICLVLGAQERWCGCGNHAFVEQYLAGQLIVLKLLPDCCKPPGLRGVKLGADT